MNDTPKDIKNIEERITQAKNRQQKAYKVKDAEASAAARKGAAVVVEFVSGVFVGGAVGYLLDMLFNTAPFFLVFMIFCGTAAGFLNVFRYIKREE